MKKYILLCLLVFFKTSVFSQYVHQSTLIGTGTANSSSVPSSFQGTAVSISADGNVAVVGGGADSTFLGAAWVYTLNGNQWSQMGSKLVPNDFVAFQGGNVRFGYATAISANGNTIAINGYYDNNGMGATWIFERSGNRWVQQGPKLIGTQGNNFTHQGESAISLSADGNTLLIGANNDNGKKGAAWIFQRSGTNWSQQGSKIEVPLNNGWSFGSSVALSADGNTALIGAPTEGASGNQIGYGYFYKRTGNTWSFFQKVSGVTINNSRLGEGVALAGNGLVAALGAPTGNGNTGLVLIYRYNSQSQQWVNEKNLIPINPLLVPRFGNYISLSKGGDTLVTSGVADNNYTGAVWAFARINGVWSQGVKMLSPISGGNSPGFGQSLSLSANGKILLVGRPGGNVGQGSALIYNDQSMLSVQEASQPELKLYPNPVQDFLYLPAGTTFSHLTLADLTGKVLLQESKPNQRVDLSTFSPGIYIVSLQQKNYVRHVRIVKE